MTSASNKHPYDNEYAEDNVYGHALALLRQNQGCSKPNAIHLDIGCGFGRIAEPLTKELGIEYVGVDGSHVGLRSLTERGFEVHQVVFGDLGATRSAIRSVIADRPLASMTMLDTLEHLPQGGEILRVLQELALEHHALVVVSAPNVSHSDVGRRLAFGKWNYTESGLLDNTHLRFFSLEVLNVELRIAGLYTVQRYDVLKLKSDQHFPESHPAIAKYSLLANFLRNLQERASPETHVVQFVCLCAPGPRLATRPFLEQREEERPFLSIITRTQGKRLHTLREVFLCLAGQTSTDFEVLVVGHELDLDAQVAVEQAIEENPEWLRRRIRLVRVEGGNRTRPLNVGFQEAFGHYISILDDDDLPLGHWVETFKRLAKSGSGRILRTVCVKQDVANVSVLKRNAICSVGAPEKLYASDFDLFTNLSENTTPNLAMAFPRGAFHDLKIQFDESLTTTEDWDFILRVAAVVGVQSDPEITSVYRWWKTAHSSRTEHSEAEWQRNHRRILDKLDDEILLLPKGSGSRIRTLVLERGRLNEEVRRTICERDAAYRELAALKTSHSSWSLSAALVESVPPAVRRKIKRAWQLLGWTLTFQLRNKRREEQRILNRQRAIVENTKWFDGDWYLEEYPDVKASGVDPLLHYLRQGSSEHRNPGPKFDAMWYLKTYPDVKAAGQNPLVHYLEHGQREGRQIRPIEQKHFTKKTLKGFQNNSRR